MLRAKGSGPNKPLAPGRRRTEHYSLGAHRLARGASDYVRRVKGSTPRTKGRALRGKCEERRAKCYVPGASRSVPRAKCSARSAWPRNRRVPSGRSRIRNPSRDADRKQGAGLRSSPGGEGCEKHKGWIFQSAWWPRGLPLLQKKIIFQAGAKYYFFFRLMSTSNLLPTARGLLERPACAVRVSGRASHDWFALVSWFYWFFSPPWRFVQNILET